MPINKFSEYTKTFLKPFRVLNKKIHEATGKAVSGGAVNNQSGVNNQMASGFRQVGSVPEDKSGFTTQHLGDNK